MIKHIIIKIIFLGFNICPNMPGFTNDIKAQLDTLPYKFDFTPSYIVDPAPQFNTLETLYDKLKILRKSVKKRPIRTISHFISLPFSGGADNTLYLAGLSITCFKNVSYPSSFSTYLQSNSFGLPRHIQSVIAAAHELGHELGCHHTENEYDIMNTNLLYYSTLHSVFFMPTCLKQIKRCLT